VKDGIWSTRFARYRTSCVLLTDLAHTFYFLVHSIYKDDRRSFGTYDGLSEHIVLAIRS
jgi:hypothetical protein